MLKTRLTYELLKTLSLSKLKRMGFSEKQILNKIFDYCKDKTLIYISHKKEIISMFKEKYKIERKM